MTPWDLAKPNNEHSHQRALFAWCNMATRCGVRVADNPLAYTGLQAELNGLHQLKYIHAIHNQGHGDAIRGSRAKAEGVKAGIPDVFLPWPMLREDILRRYHGLYIEMKKPKVGQVSEVQSQVMADLEKAGYKCVVAYGWLEARNAILEYLNAGQAR